MRALSPVCEKLPMRPRSRSRVATLSLRRATVFVLATTLAVAGLFLGPLPSAQAADPCAAPVVNRVACENTREGTDAWDVQHDTTIEGFATDMSTNVGGRVDFKIRTDSPSYRVEIYRLGWYGGAGGRFVTALTPSAALPQVQPACLRDDSVGLVDCGNWAVSASWPVPADAVSGVYVANLHRLDTETFNQITFVVRDDSSRSDMVFQTSDTTWAAYNTWGGASMYTGDRGRAYKVSYNRPLGQAEFTGQLFYAEYPMIRFLESNGYDLTYMAGVDTDRIGHLLRNHDAFLSVGHDEYWSGAQRSNVEAARDAGVNLAFFSGNEMWWKIRWEQSIDGSGAGHRTMVSYKESLDGVRTDPTGEWTGTWRDTRFAQPGVTPENALIGQQFKVNGGYYRRNSIEVPAEFGAARLWRDTAVARQAAGATYTFGAGTLGYEWDSDYDNGYRPAGLAHLSETVVQIPEPDVLQDDYGVSYTPGTAQHNLSLYRDQRSGALVFGAGTVQWSWGLDNEHDSAADVANTPMRQATVNLFADMGIQPLTIVSDLRTATASTDTAPPTVSVTAPTADQKLPVGSPVTVAGTATDASGVVSGVEVSVDGGATWHPATGRASWTYSFTPAAAGTVDIRVRAVDDSARLSSPVGLTRVVEPRECPCSLWSDATIPAVPSTNDATPLELGVRFESSVAGFVSGIRFYKGAGNIGTHTGSLWSADGTQLATGTFRNESADGWQTLAFASPVQIDAGRAYVASYWAPQGNYAATAEFFATKGVLNQPLSAPASSASAPNGLFRVGSSGFPEQTYKGANYWVDVVFQDSPPPDTAAPTATAGSPRPDSTSVDPTSPVTVVFDEPVQPAGIAMTVTPASGAPVPGSLSYDAASRTATFRPTTQLAAGTRYAVAVSGAKDVAGNAMADPVRWSFTTMRAPATPGVCPCSVWDDTAVPTVVTAQDTVPVELGMRFRPDADGTVTGARFYKGPENTGTHTGTLWSSTGQKLATATFAGESSSGWQQVTFSAPVTVTRGTTYVVSYHTTVGGYSVTPGGLAAGRTNGPLTVFADGDGGPNGLYAYGPGSFPQGAAGGANYWVDVVFAPAQDTTPPAVATTVPTAGTTGVDTSTKPSVTFTEPVVAGSATMTLTRNGTAVAGSVTSTDSGRTLSFTPGTALAPGTTYVVTVSGAKDAAGNVVGAPVTWQFTTAAAGAGAYTVFAGAVPTTTAVDDFPAVELGVRIAADVDGWISGVRFYKGSGNTGTHTGSLWSADGQRLATGTFTGETASGWQQLTFAAPVAVTAGTPYVVSYHAPSGHYAGDAGFFADAGSGDGPLRALRDGVGSPNGVYAYGSTSTFPQNTYRSTNYWVDAVFTMATPSDSTAPTVVSTSPAQGDQGVATSATIQFGFDEAVQAGTAQVSVTTAQGVGVQGSIVAVSSQVLAFRPTSGLPAGTTITATIQGTTDRAGNVMAAPRSVSFTTAPVDANGCPCTLFPEGTGSGASAANDAVPLELGVRFSTDTPGSVTGVRFYKAAGDPGTHRGSLWASDGSRLATATFTTETASGWQQVTFDQPVAVFPGQTYTASFHSSAGRYSYRYGDFAIVGIDRAPLHAPAATATAPNGVYSYGASAFPSQGGSTNYWVDVVFGTGATPAPTAPADTTAPTVTSAAPAQGTTGVAASARPAATFSEPVRATGVTALLSAGGVPVASTVAVSDRTVTVAPAAALAGGTTYTVSLSGIADLAGNPLGAPYSWSFTTADTTAPTVSTVTPTQGSTGVVTSVRPAVTFSEPVRPTSVTAVLTRNGTTVASTVAVSDRTVTVTPAAALATATTYTVSLAGIADTAGNALAGGYTWSFTTAAPPPACPCSLFGSSDSPPLLAVSTRSATERGMKFRATTDGYITAVRFYKALGGTGTHTGSLWTTSGQRLASAQFTGETALGWQTATLAQPVRVTAGTTYVVSYTAPGGRWTQTSSYFGVQKTNGPLQGLANSQSANGVSGAAGAYPATGASGANFWVDVVFTTLPAPAGTMAAAAAAPTAKPRELELMPSNRPVGSTRRWR
jgi:methionine-rich copper-binding protein CopC